MLPTRKVFLRTIGANLRRERKIRGLSQDALAHMAGLHRTYVGQVERGERNISAENIRRLARALSIVPAELLRLKNG